MNHVIPSRIRVKIIETGGAHRKIEDGVRPGATISFGIRIGRQNLVLNYLLESDPLLFWRLFHVWCQNIIVTCLVGFNVFIGFQ